MFTEINGMIFVKPFHFLTFDKSVTSPILLNSQCLGKCSNSKSAISYRNESKRGKKNIFVCNVKLHFDKFSYDKLTLNGLFRKLKYFELNISLNQKRACDAEQVYFFI